jgi:hypothetical protein
VTPPTTGLVPDLSLTRAQTRLWGGRRHFGAIQGTPQFGLLLRRRRSLVSFSSRFGGEVRLSDRRCSITT